MSQFVQLNNQDCKYLLDLAKYDDMTATARQREYTIPKLRKILNDPKSAKLAYQDVEYLLDLIEDDEREDIDIKGIEQQREMTRSTLIDIQELQQKRFEETSDLERQREERRKKINPRLELGQQFASTSAK